MAERQENYSTYFETALAFTANAEYTLNRTCDRFNIIEYVGAIEVSINDGPFSVCRGGIGYQMPPGGVIHKLKFRETAGSTANIIVATAFGEIDDNRASFAGNLPVVNAALPNDSLRVDLIAADPGLVALANAITSALQASADLRSRLTPMVTYAEAEGALTITELVSAAANTNGVIIHRCRTEINTTSGTREVYLVMGAGDDLLCGVKNGPGGVGTDVANNLFIPSGNRVRYLSSTACNIYIWYEVL